MDALFGLPRKKSAGSSYRGALHGALFFCDQSSVDEFVAGSEKTKHVPSVRQDSFSSIKPTDQLLYSMQTCNDFVAGSMLRSASRYKALDETAVFGYCCRHEFPGEFISLKHGERYVNF